MRLLYIALKANLALKAHYFLTSHASSFGFLLSTLRYVSEMLPLPHTSEGECGFHSITKLHLKKKNQ